MDAFAVLGVPRTASDAEVRSAYLSLVKKWGPEQHPQRFQTVSEAYGRIQSERDRVQHTISNRAPGPRSPFAILAAHATWPECRKPPSFLRMKEFLLECARKNT